jgi:hypothetical protein
MELGLEREDQAEEATYLNNLRVDQETDRDHRHSIPKGTQGTLGKISMYLAAELIMSGDQIFIRVVASGRMFPGTVARLGQAAQSPDARLIRITRNGRVWDRRPPALGDIFRITGLGSGGTPKENPIRTPGPAGFKRTTEDSYCAMEVRANI